jgi:hypothetical protein
MIINHIFVTTLVVVTLSLSGCMGEAAPVKGIIYTNVRYAGHATMATDVSKEGKACAETVLTLFAFGDATVSTAKANGGITQVATIEHAALNILGVYGTWCTIVRGH